jgi:adhesin HecA-like repeat protein
LYFPIPLRSSGTLYGEISSDGALNASTGQNLTLNDGTLNNFAGIRVSTASASTISNSIVVGGVTQASLSRSSLATTTANKCSVAFNTDNVLGAIGGVAGIADASATMPSCTTLGIGLNGLTSVEEGNTRNVKLYSRLLSQHQLNLLTR